MADVNFESLAEATSGAVGALVSTTVLYPLDTCKTRYQAEVGSHGQKKYRSPSDALFEAISKGHILSLYQGLSTKNLQSVIAQFLYFYGYSYFKRLYLVKSGAKSIGTTMNLIIAAAAGTCTAVITQPLDTAASKMQTSAFGKSKGLWETLTNGSLTEAFDGLSISLVLTSNPAIQYTVFDQLKLIFIKRQQSKRSASGSAGSSPESLSASSAFLLGAMSKSVATILTYPLIRSYVLIVQICAARPDMYRKSVQAVHERLRLLRTQPTRIRRTCKVMMQASDHEEDGSNEPKSKPHKTIVGGLSSIWKEEGFPGFFKGLQAQILKTVLSSALLLMIKEKILRFTWIAMLALRRYLLASKKRVKNA